MSATYTYNQGDVPGIELIEPNAAHTLRAALASYRVPTAARARILASIGRAAAEIESALRLAQVGQVRRATPQQEEGARS